MDISENNTIVILIILIILVLYLLLKSSNENFDDNNINLDNIQDEINKVYNLDIEAMKNLGAISKSLLTGKDYYTTKPSTPGNLNIPTDSTIINGPVIVGGFNLLDKLNNLQTQITNMILPKNASVVFTSPVPKSQYTFTRYNDETGKYEDYDPTEEDALRISGKYLKQPWVLYNHAEEPRCPNGWLTKNFVAHGKLVTKPVSTEIKTPIPTKSSRLSILDLSGSSSTQEYTTIIKPLADGPLVYLNLCTRP
jgi:hypothetical protein